ncbi:MAG: hypothetical protein R6U17_00825 [Thermoplasmata archaeon]
MWSPEKEKEFIESTDAVVWAAISCNECDYRYEAFFKKSVPSKCPKCDGNLSSTTPQGRNSPLSAYTEKYASDVLEEALKNAGFDDLEVKRNVICDELDLTSRSAADIAIVERGEIGRIYKPNQIKVVFEVKMSVIWNWELNEKGESAIEADYDKHKGRGSIYRTDSILKAIGKGAIFRSHFESCGIPYIVVGNSPTPASYLDKVDGSVRVGIVQRFISLTPEPLITDKSESKVRNPKESLGKGFLRIDSQEELSSFIEDLLKDERIFIGSMLKKSKLGKNIKSLDLNKDYSDIGEDFFKKLYEMDAV